MTAVDAPVPAAPHRAAWRRCCRRCCPLVLIGAVFFWFLPQFTSIADGLGVGAGHELAAARPSCCVAALWNLATYQFVMVATMPGLTFRQATGLHRDDDGGLEHRRRRGGDLAGADLRDELLLGLLPLPDVGVAAGVGAVEQLRQARAAGARPGAAGLRVRAPTAGRLVAGLLGRRGAWSPRVVVLRLLLRSRESAARLGLDCGRVASAVLPARSAGHRCTAGTRRPTKFRGRTVLLLRARWHWITLATLVSHLSLFLVLLLALRFVGRHQRTGELARGAGRVRLRPAAHRHPVHPRRARASIELALITGLAAAGGAAGDWSRRRSWSSGR